jgi:hypothetical protein
MPRVGQVFNDPEQLMTPRESEKPVLVGEANPHGGDPKYALYPYPRGCAGYRLCFDVLGMRRSDYVRSFHRVNLCGTRWRIREARNRARSLGGLRLVLLGAKVASAFDVPFEPFASQWNSTGDGGGGILVLPHPSGLCRLWNRVGSFEEARRAVVEFAPELSEVVGRFAEEVR